MSLKWIKMQLSVLEKGHGFPLPIPTTPSETGHIQVNIQHTKDTYFFSLCLALSFLPVEESIFSMQKPFHVWQWGGFPCHLLDHCTGKSAWPWPPLSKWEYSFPWSQWLAQDCAYNPSRIEPHWLSLSSKSTLLCLALWSCSWAL